jgi:lipoprotein-releasing system ATP-binding protein
VPFPSVQTGGYIDVFLIETQNLHRYLGEGETAAHVLRGVDLQVSAGSFVSLIGASGSGKSTLLYLLGGLDRPSERNLDGDPFEPTSAVFLNGQNTSSLDDQELAALRNRTIGFVFQFHYLLKEFTAQENVCLPIWKGGRMTRDEAMTRAASLLDRLGLGAKLRRRANRLSGGEQQRVALARALANEPAALLADEPTGNLDKRNSDLVAEIFQELAFQGQTIIMVTHDESLARRADRIITMVDGQIVKDEARR